MVILVLLGILLNVAISFPSAAQNGVSPNVKHLALIIGNQDYDQDGKISVGLGSAPTDGRLADLKNPCRDATMFRDKLIASKWRSDEIMFFGCDVDTATMKEQIDKFRERLTNATDTVAIFYFSGHGAQLTDGDTSHSFLFGVGAKIDIKAIADSQKWSPGNTAAFATQAVDLDELVTSVGRQPENALLIILDACRDNILYDQARNMEGAPRISAISANPSEYNGIVLAYATPAGMFSADGFGPHSIYTSAWVSLLKDNRNFDSILNKLRATVADAYRKAYPLREGIQEPATRGRFNDDWCVWACAPEPTRAPVSRAAASAARGDRGSVRALASSNLGMGDWSRFARAAGANPYRRQVNLVQAVPAPASAPVADQARRQDAQTIFDLKKYWSKSTYTFAKDMRFDVFWCDGGSGADRRYRRATDIANAISSEAMKRFRLNQTDRQSASAAGQLIASVRLRSLSSNANTLEGYRYSDDVLVYDAKDGQAADWRKVVDDVSPLPLRTSVENAQTPGYISIFVCKLDDGEANASTLTYLQVTSGTAAAAGQKFLSMLSDRVPSLKPVRGVETRNDGPLATEVRYFSTEDRNNAFQIAAEIEKLLGKEVRIQFMPRLAEQSGSHMEIWFGKSDPPLLSTGEGFNFGKVGK